MIIDPLELRSRPELLSELREHPGQHMERRVVPMTGVEARAKEDGSFRFGGLAAVFDELSQNLGGFRERIDRGAFRKVLKTDPDVRALFNHDPSRLLARTTNNTLRLKEVPKGLEYDADAAPTTYAADLRILLDRGDVDQSSFAFRIAPGGDSWDEDPETGGLIRTIHEFGELFDVSPVTDPAYTQTTSGLRSLIGDDPSHEEVRTVAHQIHRGEMEATAEQRTQIDRALEKYQDVSPWIAERVIRAVATEPDAALAAIPGMRVTVEMEPLLGEPPYRLAAAQRSLDAWQRRIAT
jgi:HK97 family phage prohead protease